MKDKIAAHGPEVTCFQIHNIRVCISFQVCQEDPRTGPGLGGGQWDLFQEETWAVTGDEQRQAESGALSSLEMVVFMHLLL